MASSNCFVCGYPVVFFKEPKETRSDEYNVCGGCGRKLCDSCTFWDNSADPYCKDCKGVSE